MPFQHTHDGDDGDSDSASERGQRVDRKQNWAINKCNHQTSSRQSQQVEWEHSQKMYALSIKHIGKGEQVAREVH